MFNDWRIMRAGLAELKLPDVAADPERPGAIGDMIQSGVSGRRSPDLTNFPSPIPLAMY